MKNRVLISIFVFITLTALCFVLIFAYFVLEYPLKYKQEIAIASSEFGVEKKYIVTIINIESNFNKNAVSKKGAVGLMQILPETACWVILTNSSFDQISNNDELFEPKLNIRIGVCYFSYLLNKFENLKTALCAYNAGEGNVSRWLENSEFSSDGTTLFSIPFPETKNYVERFEKNLKIYEKRI